MKKIALILSLAAGLVGTIHAAEIPRPAPDVSVALPGGKQVKVSDYKGKVVIFAYILTT